MMIDVKEDLLIDYGLLMIDYWGENTEYGQTAGAPLRLLRVVFSLPNSAYDLKSC